MASLESQIRCKKIELQQVEAEIDDKNVELDQVLDTINIHEEQMQELEDELGGCRCHAIDDKGDDGDEDDGDDVGTVPFSRILERKAAKKRKFAVIA